MNYISFGGTSFTRIRVEHLQSQVILLTVAAEDAQVLHSLQGRTLLRTDQNGWIRQSTDGKRMWVEVERN